MTVCFCSFVTFCQIANPQPLNDLVNEPIVVNHSFGPVHRKYWFTLIFILHFLRGPFGSIQEWNSVVASIVTLNLPNVRTARKSK